MCWTKYLGQRIAGELREADLSQLSSTSLARVLHFHPQSTTLIREVSVSFKGLQILIAIFYRLGKLPKLTLFTFPQLCV